MRRATTADPLAGGPDTDGEAHTHDSEEKQERGRRRPAELNEAIRGVDVIEAEDERERSQEREESQ